MLCKKKNTNVKTIFSVVYNKLKYHKIPIKRIKISFKMIKLWKSYRGLNDFALEPTLLCMGFLNHISTESCLTFL